MIPVSARKRDGLDVLVQKIVDVLPKGERYYPKDQYTDQPLRFMVAELIRESILIETGEEVPYASAVVIEQFEEPEAPTRPGKRPLTRIAAAIYCERDGQKAILIGKGGTKLKAIGTGARRKIESLLGTQVYLELHVIVEPGWRKSRAFVDSLDWHRQLENLAGEEEPSEDFLWRDGQRRTLNGPELAGAGLDVRRPVVGVEAELELGAFRHHSRNPGRIEDDLDVDLAHLRQCGELAFHFGLDHVGHAAAGRGKRHAHVDALAAAFESGRRGRVDEAQVDDVDRNLRIAHRLQLLPDHLLAEGPGNGAVLRLVGSGICCHRNGLRYSVETVSVLVFKRRLQRVPGQRGALDARGKLGDAAKHGHLAQIRAFASPRGRRSQDCGTRSKSLAASALVLPFRICVIIEAEAREMAQPEPWKPMSLMAPSVHVDDRPSSDRRRGD